jgi:hypothetical protein
MGPHTATPRDGGGQYIIGDTSVLGGKRRNGRAQTTDSSAVITSGEYKVNIRFCGDPSLCIKKIYTLLCVLLLCFFMQISTMTKIKKIGGTPK